MSVFGSQVFRQALMESCELQMHCIQDSVRLNTVPNIFV